MRNSRLGFTLSLDRRPSERRKWLAYSLCLKNSWTFVCLSNWVINVQTKYVFLKVKGRFQRTADQGYFLVVQVIKLLGCSIRSWRICDLAIEMDELRILRDEKQCKCWDSEISIRLDCFGIQNNVAGNCIRSCTFTQTFTEHFY